MLICYDSHYFDKQNCSFGCFPLDGLNLSLGQFLIIDQQAISKVEQDLYS